MRASRCAATGLGLLLAGVTLGVASDARACSVILPTEPGRVPCGGPGFGGDGGVEHTAVSALGLEVEATEIVRSSYPPPGRGDCGELGRAVLRFRLGGAGWPGDVGVLVSPVAGHFPWFQPPLASTGAGSGWLLVPAGGEVSFFGPDDPRAPLDVTLSARAIDCGGETSSPVEIRLTHPGRAAAPAAPAALDAGADPLDPLDPLDALAAGAVTSDAPASSRGAGCSLSLFGARSAGAGLGVVLAAALARRRRPRAVRST